MSQDVPSMGMVNLAVDSGEEEKLKRLKTALRAVSPKLVFNTFITPTNGYRLTVFIHGGVPDRERALIAHIITRHQLSPVLLPAPNSHE